MKYFNLRYDIDPSVVGVVPQSESIKYRLSNNQGREFISYNKNYKPNIDFIELMPRAKVTDIIDSSISSIFGRVISSKFLNILSEFNCPDYNVYPVKLKKKSVIIDDYFIIKFNEDIYHWIDNRKSEIILRLTDHHYDFSSYSHKQFVGLFKNELKNRRFKGKVFFYFNFEVGKICFVEDFNFDFFSASEVPIPRPGMFMSQRLVEAIKENGITGCRFDYIENIVISN